MKKIIFIFASSLTIAQAQAAAEPGYYLVTTYEDEGAKTLDFKLWDVNVPRSKAVYSPEIGFGYGVTKRWYTEFSASTIHTDSGGTVPSNLDWQNDFMLTQGQYPVDLALHTTIKRHHDTTRGLGFEFGPVMQTEFGRTQVNMNIFFERNYRSDVPDPMQMKYQLQVKYRWRPMLEFGVQGFGELGKWDHWASHETQSHRIGPMISGTLPLGETQAFKYEAAYFVGSIFTRHAHVFSMRAQYEF
jgi:hypothetical protein